MRRGRSRRVALEQSIRRGTRDVQQGGPGRTPRSRVSEKTHEIGRQIASFEESGAFGGLTAHAGIWIREQGAERADERGVGREQSESGRYRTSDDRGGGRFHEALEHPFRQPAQRTAFLFAELGLNLLHIGSRPLHIAGSRFILQGHLIQRLLQLIPAIDQSDHALLTNQISKLYAGIFVQVLLALGIGDCFLECLACIALVAALHIIVSQFNIQLRVISKALRVIYIKTLILFFAEYAE